MSDAPRLLLPLTYGLSVRYSLPTGLVRELATRTDLVVALGWDDLELKAELGALGAEVLQLPAAILTYPYRMFRRRLGALRDRRLDSPTTPIRVARQRAALPGWRELTIDQVRRWRDLALIATANGATVAEAAESGEVEAGTNVADFRSFLDLHSVDAVLSLTPYHDQDALLLWAARSTGRPTVTSMISFDNPTTRERLTSRSERMLVWNRFNAQELLRSYPDLTEDRIGIVGAPQFDLHHRPDLLLPRDEWCRSLGLPGDRPVILYGAGPAELIPGEERLVALIDDAIDDGRIPGRPTLLVRRHPVDTRDRWTVVSTQLRHGVVADPWVEGPDSYRSWPTHDDIVMQMSSLAHSSVHVNVCSSMSLDGAIFDRPQVCPMFVPGATWAQRRRVSDLYRQEHWQPVARSGGVVEVRDGASLVDAITAGLDRREVGATGRRRLVLDLLTYDDGESTARLVDEVARFLGGAVQRSSAR